MKEHQDPRRVAAGDDRPFGSDAVEIGRLELDVASDRPDRADLVNALAATDGEAQALTNLGILVARGQGAEKSDPISAALLWRAAAARGEENGNGRITILVSHRFSTVRMADLIIVLDGAKLVEVGTHEELMAKRGPYSELYAIQAAAYR